jgi:hypothetical protein
VGKRFTEKEKSQKKIERIKRKKIQKKLQEEKMKNAGFDVKKIGKFRYVILIL